ncbi:MAG TPA: chemotaxis response regulator protein-glutamate methylesterase [Hyphomicrobiales bacterium]|nr:chemotaxis response regulator protein-glutamate methylesterase [Kaistiaceae bacterium]HQF31965.1 chemotaxis response regulator protein-glutamate methylesterase [Hyphomicrobiales bacterium]
MTLSAPLSARPAVVTDPVRVMVVDDSVVIRGLIGRWVDEDPALAVVSSHRNGRLAVEDIERSDPDVVVLDIEMPDMDGLTALPLMLKKKPGLIVIMASTLTRRNAEISLKALSLGAADYIPKPESNSGITTSVDFRRDLLDKVRSLGQRARLRAGRHVTAHAPAAPGLASRPLASAAPARPAPAPLARPATTATTATTPAPAMHAAPGGTFRLRPFTAHAPKVLVIGSSTGGPQALAVLFEAIAPAIARVPVLLTQHMPPTFTAILAEHIAKTTGRHAAEAEHGEAIEPGRIYVAPGGRHMLVAKRGTQAFIEIDNGPAVNFCKPAVDPMFDTASAAYGSGVLGVVLTGMGADGARGAVTIANAGGNIIAQDEASSVVWGMPGATAQSGACAAVLPLTEIGPRIKRILGGER